ncbi:MAG TPA: DinB family protein [Capsulimonadaceae bacterium]|nr:DinB family protein [Capsulimonadaceae bacterium]
MLVESQYFKGYLMGALEETPALFARLLDGIADEQADRRPDPDRFTIREVMAHLADWEPVLQERLRMTRDEDQPTLEVVDPAKRAIEHDYAHSDVREQLQLFAERRAATSAIVRNFTLEQWERKAIRPNIGAMTMESIVALIPLHDMYHLRQVAEWLSLTAC